MCLAVPGKVAQIYEENGVLMGKIDFGGVLRRACLEHVREARPGDYVLVHVGYALSRVDTEEAEKTLNFLEELGELKEWEAGSDEIRR